MIFNERYKDLIKTANQIKEQFGDKICIENNVVKDIDVFVTGHFGCTVSVALTCENICPLGLYNSTHNIGYILRALIEIFDKEDDDPVSIYKLKNTPIRLVFNGVPWGSKAIAIGHFMKDRFVVIDELMKITQ